MITSELLKVSSRAQLVRSLKALDLSVPTRLNGRKTEHCELWTIGRLLSTLAGFGEFSFPLIVNHQDRPDFLIVSSGQRIGIEVTEATTKNMAQFAALLERRTPRVGYDIYPLRPGTPMLSKRDLRELLDGNHPKSEGWVRGQAEREWSTAIAEIIRKKMAKSLHPEFQRYDGNWLSIYDNLPLNNDDLEAAINLTKEKTLELWDKEGAFDRIFIECERKIIELSRIAHRFMTVSDLWQESP